MVKALWCLSCQKRGHQGVKRSKFSAASAMFQPYLLLSPEERHVGRGAPWLGSLTCPHIAFLSSLGLWLFLDDALKNDSWLLSQAPEAVQPKGCSV